MRNKSQSQKEKGSWFEHATLQYLLHSNLWNVKSAHLWDDWEYKDAADTGIDIVVELHNGELCAVQCKIYSDTHTLSKSDINSFLEKASRPTAGIHTSPFSHKIVSYIGGKISSNAMDAISEHQCRLLLEEDFEICGIDWGQYISGKITHKRKFEPKPHQIQAINNVVDGFTKSERGILIMACGTGKTFTSLCIAENICKPTKNSSKLLLYLVPSISLMRQTIHEWAANQTTQTKYMAVCSDTKVARNDEDALALEIPIPVTTNVEQICQFVRQVPQNMLGVVFCTYQSLKHIADTQKQTDYTFDLIICDEAHRTTGAEQPGVKHTKFTLVHNNNLVKSNKRLYMTATDRYYTDSAKEKADIKGAKIHSMDDMTVYGPIFHKLKFSEAVDKNLLTDYRVLVLNVDEDMLRASSEFVLQDNAELTLHDYVKMVGCWKALQNPEWSSKRKSEPLKRAIVYTNLISQSLEFSEHFTKITDDRFRDSKFKCAVKHVSGLQDALERGKSLRWLKTEQDDDELTTCKILSNAKCLGEGIDVPALDAIVFLNPRRSAVEIIQAVGRVMRKPKHLQHNKKFGYVVLPVVVPSNDTPESSLNSNEHYKVVWDVLRALRSHDDLLDRSINQWRYKETAGLKKALKGKVIIGSLNDNGKIIDISDREDLIPLESIRTKIVEKVGTREYWGGWTQDIISVTHRIRQQICVSLKNKRSKERFDKFVLSLQKTLNESINEHHALDMLTQHIVTMPIFEALFDKGSFKTNPISKIMNETISSLDLTEKFHERRELKPFYERITAKVKGMSDDPKSKQELIKDLYGDFFEIVFKDEAKKLGIVYTPIQIVDFMLQSVNYVMQTHFDKQLTHKNVNIIDPFTGTGSFVTRFLDESLGLLRTKDAARKYNEELHANEITLMAYYIASVNIAATFEFFKKGVYDVFPGLLFTDTFAQNIPVSYPELAKKITRQKQKRIEVVIGNPPYSDRKTNIQYTDLIKKIRSEYGLGKGVSDSYIRAFMWATDRLSKNGNNNGVIAFVTNSGFLANSTLSKMRNSLANTFSHIYIIDLRGDQQETRGESSKIEGGKVFGKGSRQPIAITILVKKTPQLSAKCLIRRFRVPDRQSRHAKLRLLETIKSIENISDNKSAQYTWEKIIPNKWDDWVDQRDEKFENYSPLQKGVFNTSVRAIYSGRVGWVYNSSHAALAKNMKKSIQYVKTLRGDEKVKNIDIAKLQPSGGILERIKRYSSRKPAAGLKFKYGSPIKNLKFDSSMLEKVYLKPFLPQWHYKDPLFNEDTSLSDWFLHGDNIAICVSDKPKGFPFSTMMVDRPVDIKFLYNAICFPRYAFKMCTKSGRRHIVKVSNISHNFHNHINKIYNTNQITDDDIFYYVYAVLHSKHYLEQNSNNLKHMVPRIPLVDDLRSFKHWSHVGLKLSSLHLNWETFLRDKTIEQQITVVSNRKFPDWKIDNLDIVAKPKNSNTVNVQINQNLVLSIPKLFIEYEIEGRTPLDWLVSHWKFSTQGMKNINGVRYYDFGIINNMHDVLENPHQIKNYVSVMLHISQETDKLINLLGTPKWLALDKPAVNSLANYA